MQKIKSFNFNSFISILKCCLLGIVATLIGTLIFAFVLKFTDLSSLVISYINDAIKALSIFVVMLCIKKSNDGKLMLKAVLAGIIYACIAFIIFSIMNGGFVFNMSFVFDLLFAIAVAIITSIIVNLTIRKKEY